MKNTSIFLNIVLLVAVAVLYYLHFTAPKAKVEKKEDIPVKEIALQTGDMKIAFVDLEQLLIDYKLSTELNDQFNARKDDAQGQLNKQVEQLEKEMKAYQEKVQLGTFLNPRSAENQKQQLIERNQKLQELQYELEGKLLEEQQNLNIQLYDSVMNYLNKYNDVQNFQYIFSKMDGGNLLIGSPELDITADIIDGLNQRYTVLKEEE